jgi:hypothetical protein
LYIFHRCTRVENPGEGVAEAYSKILGGGGVGLSQQIADGGPLFWAFNFYHIFNNKFFLKICLWDPLLYPPSPLTPLSASMNVFYTGLENVSCICSEKMFWHKHF